MSCRSVVCPDRFAVNMLIFIPGKMTTQNLSDQVEALTERLKQPLPGIAAQERMAGRVVSMPPQVPGNARNSAVLSLLFPVAGILQLVLIQRTEDGGRHSGQVGFPGGRHEPEDSSFEATALRETQEEIGLDPAGIQILGALTPLYIPVSNFIVHPFVGFVPQRPSYVLSRDEVAGVYETAVPELFMPDRKIITKVRPSSAPELVLTVPAYTLQGGPVIWGATAMMLSELEAVWQAG